MRCLYANLEEVPQKKKEAVKRSEENKIQKKYKSRVLKSALGGRRLLKEVLIFCLTSAHI